MQTTNDILLEILTIIQYADDKEKFVEEFTTLNQMEVLQSMAHKLPDEIKNKTDFTKEDIAWVQQHVHITEQEFLQKVEEIAQKQLREYVNALAPELSKEERQQIDVLMRQQKSKRPYKNPLGFLARITSKIFRHNA